MMDGKWRAQVRIATDIQKNLSKIATLVMFCVCVCVRVCNLTNQTCIIIIIMIIIMIITDTAPVGLV